MSVFRVIDVIGFHGPIIKKYRVCLYLMFLVYMVLDVLLSVFLEVCVSGLKPLVLKRFCKLLLSNVFFEVMGVFCAKDVHLARANYRI